MSKNSSQSEHQILIHDLREAVRTLRLVYQDIEGGYRFADDVAQAKLAAFNKSVTCLESNLAKILASVADS